MKIKSIAISLILSAFIFTGCATKSTTQDTGLKKNNSSTRILK